MKHQKTSRKTESANAGSLPRLVSDCEASVLAHTSSNGRYVTDEKRVIEMANAGLLKDYGAQQLAGGMHYLTLTELGRKALQEWRAAQPKPKPVKRRSEQCDRWRDCVEACGRSPCAKGRREVWPVRYASYR